MLRNLNQRFGASRLLASCRTGVRGMDVSRSGTNGPSWMAPSIDPVADAQTEFRYWVTGSNVPAGSMIMDASGSGALVGLPNGHYVIWMTLYAFDVPRGQFSVLVSVGVPPPIGAARLQVQMAPGGGSLLHDGTPPYIGAGRKTLVA